MIHPTSSKSGRILFAPVISFCHYLGNHHPELLLKTRYFLTFRKKLNLSAPQDLNEKILWAKLYADTTQWSILADKYTVRKYVEEKGLAECLVRLYGAWDDITDFDFDQLPENFILKANNGDGKGTNKAVEGKSHLSPTQKQELLATMDEWLHRKNIGLLHAEPHYKRIHPMVIAEELLPTPEGGSSLTDYKIWCFNGKAHYIMTCSERASNGSSAHLMLYDREWNACPQHMVSSAHYPQGEILPKPENLARMIEVAETLSEGFPEIRVDLYNPHPESKEGAVYFGELTFTSLGGLMDYFTPTFLKMAGSLFDIKDYPKTASHDLVSIIMPTHNDGKYLAGSIGSILNQTHSELELLITDDASTDSASLAILHEMEQADARVKVTYLKENQGAGFARNEAIGRAKGRYIAFCDADDRWTTDKLEEQIYFMQREGCAVSCASYLICDTNYQPVGINIPPRIITPSMMRRDNKIGCLTALYDVEKTGRKFYMPTIRKRQDWAMFIEMTRETGGARAYTDKPLALYCRRNGSVSSKKTALIPYNIVIYRKVLHYSKLRSILYFFLLFLPTYGIKKMKRKCDWMQYKRHNYVNIIKEQTK